MSKVRTKALVGPKNVVVARYWLSYYLSSSGCGHQCGLCGNSGTVDTRKTLGRGKGIKTACICPNGQALRKMQGAA